MSDIMVDDLDDAESMEYWGGGGGDEGAEYDLDTEADDFPDMIDGEAAEMTPEARTRERRRRARRRAMARRRAALARARRRRTRRLPATRPKTPTAAIQRTRAEVQDLELETKVQADSIESSLGSLRRRSSGTEQTAALLPVATQLQAEIGKFETDLGPDATNLLKGLAGFLPLAFLKSPNRGLANPQVQATLAGVAVAGGGFLIRRLREDNGNGDGNGNEGEEGNGKTHPLRILDREARIAVGGKRKLGVTGQGTVTWESDKRGVAEVDSAGVVTGLKAGVANVTARRGEEDDTVPVEVTPLATGK